MKVKRKIMLYLVFLAMLGAAVQGCVSQKEGGNTTKESKTTEAALEEEGKPAGGAGEAMAAPSATGKLHVEGARLVGSNGEPVQLKGISTHGIAWFPGYVNEECFRQLHEEWKANVIRLAMYTAESGGYCSDGDREYLKGLVRDGVSYAKSQDMYVIIDWHILSDSNPNMHKDEAKDFFAEMSAEYAGECHVLYEICNEPNGGTSWGDIKSYAEEVISVIRANDKDAVILVGTPNWSQFVDEAAADPIVGYDNLMYTLHFYAATHTDDLRGRLSQAVEAGLPVFVSEYGICDASGNGAIDEDQADQWAALLDSYGISYVAWNLSNKEESSAIFNSSCSKVNGFTRDDLSESGRWVYRTLTGSGREEPIAGSDEAVQGTGEAAKGTDEDMQGTVVLTSKGIEVTAHLKNSWEAAGENVYQYDLTLKNVTDEEYTRWEIELTFDGNIRLTDGWNGKYIVKGNVLNIASEEYNGALPPGDTVSDVGFIISGDGKIRLQ